MTTPAQTINTILSNAGTIQRTRIYTVGPPIVDPVSVYTNNFGWNRNMRPASGSSPVRPDGSRAPRAWDRRWGVLAVPNRDYSYFYGVGGNPYYRRDVYGSLLTAIASNGLDNVLSACGASWSRAVTAGAFPSGVESMARTKLRNQLQDGKAEWGVTLGEMRQTVKGLHQFSSETLDVITWLSKSAKRAKREVVKEILGIPPGTRKAPPWVRGKDRKIVDGWLEYQFSVKPLLGDIQTSSQALSDLLFEELRPMRMKFKAGGSDRTVTSYKSGSGFSPGWTGSVQAETSTQCHISAIYDITPTTTRTLGSLGLTNPLSTAWELTTLSWMVDYVWGVGDWLKSLTKIDGASFVEGSLTRVQRCSFAGPVSFTPDSSSVKLVKGFNDYEVSMSAGRMQRVVISDVQPGLHPAFRNRMGLTQMANSLAVLSNLLR